MHNWPMFMSRFGRRTCGRRERVTAPVDPTIRRATPDDAATLSRLALDTFMETFGHVPYPAEDLQPFLASRFSEAAHRQLLQDPGQAMWLLDHDGEALGYVLVGPCALPHPDVRADHGELKRLYLLRRAQNGGWGGRLFQTALDWLQRDGPITLWIGVWSENQGAQRFYARHGFAMAGEYEFPVGRVRDREFVLRRPATHAQDTAAQ